MARALAVVGLVFLVGTIVDLGLLWFGQRQPGIQWEFVAVTNTAEAWPRLILAVAFIYLSRYLAGSTPRWLGLTLAGMLLILGLGGGALGVLGVLNYLSVTRGVDPASTQLFLGAALKTVTLCGLYVLLLIPVGVMGLKKPLA